MGLEEQDITLTKEAFMEALKSSWVDGWNERKLFESEVLDAITDDLKRGLLTKEHSDALLQVRADLGNDGARFLEPELETETETEG